MTETMTTHSPLPWRVDDLGDEFFLATNHRYGIGSTAGTGRVAKVEGCGARAFANGELIVRAVNAHEQLLAACKAILDDASPCTSAGSSLVDNALLDQLRAAAEGR